MANWPPPPARPARPAPSAASWPRTAFRSSSPATASSAAGGSLGGFSARDGINMKQRMLELEGACRTNETTKGTTTQSKNTRSGVDLRSPLISLRASSCLRVYSLILVNRSTHRVAHLLRRQLAAQVGRLIAVGQRSLDGAANARGGGGKLQMIEHHRGAQDRGDRVGDSLARRCPARSRGPARTSRETAARDWCWCWAPGPGRRRGRRPDRSAGRRTGSRRRPRRTAPASGRSS